jgi:hypothetical protein
MPIVPPERVVTLAMVVREIIVGVPTSLIKACTVVVDRTTTPHDTQINDRTEMDLAESGP